MTEDIRWKQRFSNYLRALQTLAEGIAVDILTRFYPAFAAMAATFAALGSQANPDA